MAKIRHVAFMVKDAQSLRDFYQQGFGFEQCYESKTGSIMVLDGTFNLALLMRRQGESAVLGTHRADGGEADQRLGINHFGFVVDDLAAALNRVGADLKRGVTPQDGRPAEMRVIDPWANGFDLSARGYFGREERRLPAVRQVVLQADQPAEVAAFYQAKLDLAEQGSDPDGTVYLGDGLVRLTIAPRGLTDKRGIQAIGIQVDDWEATAARFRAMRYPLPTPNDQGEVILNDPEGNVLVLSQTGWAR